MHMKSRQRTAVRGWSWSVALLGLAITPSVATASDEMPEAGFPITDPSYQPETMGVGHEPGVQAATNTPTILFVNFDGPTLNSGCGNDSQNDCSTLFSGPVAPFPGDDAKRAAVIQAVRDDVEDFGVIVVGERPPAGNPYAMVVVGVPEGFDAGQIGGVAPGIDCGNTNPNITSFAFLVDSGSNVLATVIHQEAAHTWGLEHVDDSLDNLYPTAGGTLDPKYRDQCSKIVANTDLTPTAGQCNSIHTQFCDSGFQNSYQEMLLLFGEPVPDTAAPTVTIDAPLDGDVLDFEQDFQLTITLDDDRRPQILETQIFFDDVEVASSDFINTTLTFPVKGGAAPQGHGLSNGEHSIRVDIADEWGNPATAEINIIIENGPGAPAPGDGDGDGGSGGSDGGTGGSGGEGSSAGSAGAADDTESGCACSTHSGSGSSVFFALGLLGLGLVRRRR